MDSFWLDDPQILYSKSELSNFYPSADMTMNEKLNSMVRLAVYIGAALTILKGSILYLFIPIVVAFLTVIIQKRQEDFCDLSSLDTLTLPEADNPYMNFNLITDPRDKPEATPYSRKMGKTMDELFYKNLHRDVSDVFEKEHNQRIWATNPVTTAIPDQTAYAKWLYQAPPTCKEEPHRCAPPHTTTWH